MADEQHVVDQFNHNDEEVSQPMMKIRHTNLLLNSLLDTYLKEQRMIILVLSNFVLNHALSSSFAIPMQWPSLVASTTVHNKIMEMVTFRLISNKTKKLTKKKFAQILKLSSTSTFHDVTTKQLIQMFNEMGHQPTLSVISHFKKSSYPCIWSFFFDIIL